MANTLFIVLEGPLQSWGERAHWSVRDTAFEPTKSGVVGLLACALGWNSDPQLAALAARLRIGVRCDRPGVLLTDYHTVYGGVMSAEGKVKINAKTKQPETIVSWRNYLCDASFLVAIQAEGSLIDELAEAVQDPYWQIYLGRKCCVPGRPVYEKCGDYSSLLDALKAIPPIQHEEAEEEVQVRVIIETDPTTGVPRRDQISSRSKHTFIPRFVNEDIISLSASGKEEVCTFHD